jgi:transcriptional regulator with XRE-family HTH domain
MKAKDVKRIRAKLELSQSQFAELLGVSVRTVQQWEQDRQAPGAPAASLLKLADRGLLPYRIQAEIKTLPRKPYTIRTTVKPSSRGKVGKLKLSSRK